LCDGYEFLAHPLSKTDPLNPISLALNFSNHKGTTKAPEKLRALLLEDFLYGFDLPVDISLATKMLGLILAPMNITQQNL
jgi:hypothetical protein